MNHSDLCCKRAVCTWNADKSNYKFENRPRHKGLDKTLFLIASYYYKTILIEFHAWYLTACRPFFSVSIFCEVIVFSSLPLLSCLMLYELLIPFFVFCFGWQKLQKMKILRSSLLVCSLFFIFIFINVWLHQKKMF